MVLIEISLFLLLLSSSSAALNKKSGTGSILVWQDVASRSHFIALKPLVRRLADDGHDVVFVSAWPDPKLAAHANVDMITLDNASVKPHDSKSVFEGQAGDFREIVTLILRGQNASLSDPRVLRLFEEDKDRFDAMVISFFCMDAGLHAAKHIFRVPYAIFGAGSFIPSLDLAMGNPTTPSYIPVGMTHSGSVMSFKERMQNAFLSLLVPAFIRYWMLPPVSRQMKELLKLDYEPDLWADLMDANMILLNTHPVLDAARPVTFNTILVGGIHMDEPHHHKLPEDMKRFMDEAKEGVIVVSFGSILSANELPEDKLAAFLSVFRTRPERVVWKWEADTMPNKPDNVFITKWMPQADALAHPNVKLFVTHGGLLGCQESLHAGVPMLVLPGFGDQFANAQRVSDQHWGKHILWTDLDETSLKSAVETILGDSSFSSTTHKVSEILRDESVLPVAKAAFHVGHMMRHEGNPHLKPSSKNLRWYELLLLDVIGAVLILLYVAFVVVKSVFNTFCWLCCGAGAKKEGAKKGKKEGKKNK